MAQSQKSMAMIDWIKQLDIILQMNGKEILKNYGNISHALAIAKSEKEYEAFKIQRKLTEKQNSLQELEKDLRKM